MKKPASKVAEPAQIQPKSQFLFHKNLPPRDFSLMTLGGLLVLGLKEGLVECATVCVKSEVILLNNLDVDTQEEKHFYLYPWNALQANLF